MELTSSLKKAKASSPGSLLSGQICSMMGAVKEVFSGFGPGLNPSLNPLIR